MFGGAKQDPDPDRKRAKANATAVAELAALLPVRVEWKKSPFLDNRGDPLKSGSLYE